MTVLLEEMTRDQIEALAPTAIAILPTASIEQHGPHLPVLTDTLLCGTVARLAAEQAQPHAPVVVAPVLCYGNSHHHRPFAGVLSLTSHTYMTAVTEVLEGLLLSGFTRLVVLNGHGGNTDSNAVVALDFVNRLDHPAIIATAAYWDIARAALIETGILTHEEIPGHAGRFETDLVLAIRPELVDPAVLSATPDVRGNLKGLFADLGGGVIQQNGVWAAGPGYTDNPAAASASEGATVLEIVVGRVAAFMMAFHERAR